MSENRNDKKIFSTAFRTQSLEFYFINNFYWADFIARMKYNVWEEESFLRSELKQRNDYTEY